MVKISWNGSFVIELPVKFRTVSYIGDWVARELISNQSAIKLSITYPRSGDTGIVEAATAAAAPPAFNRRN